MNIVMYIWFPLLAVPFIFLFTKYKFPIWGFPIYYIIWAIFFGLYFVLDNYLLDKQKAMEGIEFDPSKYSIKTLLSSERAGKGLFVGGILICILSVGFMIVIPMVYLSADSEVTNFGPWYYGIFGLIAGIVCIRFGFKYI